MLLAIYDKTSRSCECVNKGILHFVGTLQFWISCWGWSMVLQHWKKKIASSVSPILVSGHCQYCNIILNEQQDKRWTRVLVSEAVAKTSGRRGAHHVFAASLFLFALAILNFQDLLQKHANLRAPSGTRTSGSEVSAGRGLCRVEICHIFLPPMSVPASCFFTGICQQSLSLGHQWHTSTAT